MEKIWIEGPVEGYLISNFGEVLGKRGKLMKPVKDTRGYLRVNLSDHGCPEAYSVAQLVAECFVPNTEGFAHVTHIDGDITNNRADNLKWGRTATEKPFKEQFVVDLEGEIWKPISYYGGKYLVSNRGRVRSKTETKDVLLKLNYRSGGSVTVSLYDKGLGTKWNVARLVAREFIEGNFNLFVCHKDGDPQNNDASNLFYHDGSKIC